MQGQKQTENYPKWVTEKTFAELTAINPQTLRNWRYLDRRAGRMQASDGFPEYKRFGKSVRYKIDGLGEK